MSDLLFRSNASSSEKAFTLLAIGICLLSAYGFTTKFSPSPQVNLVAWYLAALCGVLFTVAILRDRHPNNRLRTCGLFKKLCCAAFLLVVAVSLSWSAIGLGAASLANSILGSVSESPARVIAILSPNHGKGCKFSFSLRYVASGETGSKLCVSEDYWLTLRVGQEILVIQRRSALGVGVVGYRNDT